MGKMTRTLFDVDAEALAAHFNTTIDLEMAPQSTYRYIHKLRCASGHV